MGWASSMPRIPRVALSQRSRGMKYTPERSSARKEAGSAFPELCSVMLVSTEKGISTTIFREHMLGVGVPVLVGGWPIASIGMCLPRFRCSESRLGIIHEVLGECAASIAEKVRSAYYSG